MKLRHLPIGICLVVLAAAKDYSGYKVLRVQVENEQHGKLLQDNEEDYMFWNDIPRRGYADIMVRSEDTSLERRLKHQGVSFSTMIEDVQTVIAEQKAKSLKHRALRSAAYIKQGHNMDWEDYHPLEDIYGWLDYLEGIHANEWISPATVTFMLNELTANLAPENQDLIDLLDWYILPVHNPDGYAYTHSVDRLWRKTRSPNPNGLCVGTDPNRNWGFMWNEGGSSNVGCSAHYHGEHAFSEVENTNVRDFIQARRGSIRYFDTVHSYSQMVLLPWGNDTEPNPQHDPQVALAQKGLAALEAVHGTQYQIGCIPCLLYVATGGSLDWALGDQDIKYSFSLELRDTGEHGVLLPPDQIVPTGEETWAFHVAVAREIIKEFGGQEQ